MRHPSPFVVAPCLLVLTTSAICQSRTVPAHAAVADGHERFGVSPDAFGFRWQILVDATAVAPNGAILTGLAFRSDEREPWPGSALTNVSVSVSQTIVSVAGMSTSFASNVGGATTPVFQGTVSFPGTGVALAGPGPWDVLVPFTAPYVFTTAQGNLLIDITKPGPAGGVAPIGYFLDVVCGGGSGTRFGVAGAAALPSVPSHSAPGPARTLTTGNAIPFGTMWGTNFFGLPPPPGLIALGLAPQPAPVSLGVLGAPGNFLYVDPQVLSFHGWTMHSNPVPTFAFWIGGVSFAVPNQPALVGVMLYSQAACLDPAANALGLVVANAVEVRVGDASEQLPLRMLVGASGAASGSFLPCAGPAADHGALALRLDGSFF